MKIYSVAELTREVKDLIEGHFLDVTVTGEISNFVAHSSGHFYLSLKDDKARLKAVMFRGTTRTLKFTPEDGLEVMASGRLSIYEPRGEYQLILNALAPKGIGALQLAFEQLKKKLEKEGLFDPAHKKDLPFLPQSIGIITSPTGAAVRDLIQILTRRVPNIHILLYPVRVQGNESAQEIASAIEEMNHRGECDLLIVGRGGGSLEDLWAFNEEAVARAIFASEIPIISAVGHESDVTISDLVADLRAPTPSAAAELAVPVLEDLLEGLKGHEGHLIRSMRKRFSDFEQSITYMKRLLKDPSSLIEDFQLRLDHLRENMISRLIHKSDLYTEQIKHLSTHLQSLSPLKILERGYCIATPKGRMAPLKRARDAKTGDTLTLTLHQGSLDSKVL